MSTLHSPIPWRPALRLLGAAALAALLWWAGPLVEWRGWAPLQARPALLAAVAALLLTALLFEAWMLWRQRRANDRLLSGLLGGADDRTLPPPPGSSPADKEVALLQQRFQDAVALLRRSGLGGRHPLLAALAGRPLVYQLPWYLIIGAPGAGKTTALRHSGLEFPLAEPLGEHRLGGIGGTRHCDWWFTREAVIIDTAGRYTTQEARPEVDRAAWAGFLKLLARGRPRRPINGVLLAVSASELLARDEPSRRHHAAELRERLAELQRAFGIRFPVYVLVTKTDLLAGFAEFFADFDAAARAQAWGVTLPLDDEAAPGQPAKPGADPLLHVGRELAALERRLDECMFERLHAEPDRERRGLVHAFPPQWRLLRAALVALLQDVFPPSAEPARPLLRGLYFTSGTQEGRPMDRVLGEMGRALGLGGQLVPPPAASGKSFFVTRLLKDVVFAEAGLAGTQLKQERRRAALQLAGSAAAGGVVLVAGLVAWQHWRTQRDAVQALQAKLAPVAASLGALRARPAAELQALLPALDALQSLMDEGAPDSAAAAGAGGTPTAATTTAAPRARSGTRWHLAAAFDPHDALQAGAADAYRQLLREALLPRIALRLESQLRGGAKEHVASVYEALRAYLMLFAGRHVDAAALRGYLVTDWDLSLQGATPSQKQALQRHLDRLLATGEAGAPSLADPQLIAQSRSLVATVPLPERAYLRLRQLASTAQAPAFTLEGEAGAAATRWLQATGAAAAGVPGFYTRTAFEEAMRRRTQEALAQFAQEQAWVLGDGKAAGLPAGGAPAPTAADLALVDAVGRLYAADYLRHWQAFVDGLRLAPAPTLQASEALGRELSRRDSALMALLRGVVRETSVDAPGAGMASPREAFRPLAAWLSGATPPALSLEVRWEAAARHLAEAQAALQKGTLAPATNDLRALATAAREAPAPIPSLVGPWSERSTAQLLAALKPLLSRRIANEAGAACRNAVQDRYPLQRRATQEATREAFAATFAHGGALDEFFQRQLAPYVDTTVRPWRAALAGDALPPELLQPFERAQGVREAFLADGGKRVDTRLELRLLAADPEVQELLLELDGKPLRLRRDAAPAPQTLRWPGDGAGRLRVAMALAGGGTPAYVFEGPWSLLRLLDRVRVEPGGTAERNVLVFDLEGRKARVEARSPTPLNAVRREALEQFACPR